MKAASKAKEKYNKANYDRVTFRVQKDWKHFIEAAAERCGMSMNAFISRVVMDEVFRVFDDGDDVVLAPAEVSTEEWVPYVRRKWQMLPESVKPKGERLSGSRTFEEEAYLFEANRIKKEMFEKALEEKGVTYE